MMAHRVEGELVTKVSDRTGDGRSAWLGMSLPEFTRTWTRDLFIERTATVYGASGVSASAAPEANLHTDDSAAQAQGLDQIVGSGPQVIALVTKSMMAAFGVGWVAGGAISVKMIKSLLVGDTTTSKGRVVTLSLLQNEGGEEFVRATCDVRVVRDDGVELLVGTASAVVG